MKKLVSILSIICCMLFFMALPYGVDAQNGSRPKSKSKSKKVEAKEARNDDFKERLWYGINIGNIGGSQGYFGVGLSPIMAYKITPALSVGVMAKVDYSYFNLRNSNHPVIKKFETLDYGPTVFARFKASDRFFVQAEYENAFFQVPEIVNRSITVENNKVKINKISRAYAYLGLGYIQGQGSTWGYNVSFFYNVIQDANDLQRPPYDIRGGLTYNF